MAHAPRFLGIDEGPFTFDEDSVAVAGVMTRGAQPVEAVLVDRVTVDGWDATECVLRMARRLPGAGPDVVLVDGITLGGMNLVDLARIATELGVPVLGVTRREPGAAGLQGAAERAAQPARRRTLLPVHAPVRIEIDGRTLWVQHEDPRSGHVEAAQATRSVLEPAMGESGVPEALRLAHHVATAIVRGVSGTPA